MCACVKLLIIIIVVCCINLLCPAIVDFCGFSVVYVNLNESMSNMSNAFWWFFHPTAMNMIFNIQEAQTAIKGAQSAFATRQKWQWNKINFHFCICFCYWCCWCNSQFSHLKWNHQHWIVPDSCMLNGKNCISRKEFTLFDNNLS